MRRSKIAIYAFFAAFLALDIVLLATTDNSAVIKTAAVGLLANGIALTMW